MNLLAFTNLRRDPHLWELVLRLLFFLYPNYILEVLILLDLVYMELLTYDQLNLKIEFLQRIYVFLSLLPHFSNYQISLKGLFLVDALQEICTYYQNHLGILA